VVLECDLEAAQSQIERLQKWVFGEYTIPIGEGQAEAKVTVDASIGLAQWQPGETIKELIRRADSTMYRMKQQGRGHNA
jgi:diguanylate cyclase (GGDEF)-like protein